MSGHAARLLSLVERAQPGMVLVRESDLNDLIRVLVEARRAAGPGSGRGTSHAWRSLVKAVASIPLEWPATNDVIPTHSSAWQSTEDRAEMVASGLACTLMSQGRWYIVASATEPGRTYTVRADGDDWRAWRCSCQGGAHTCRHKRRARQEAEAAAKRAEREARRGPAAGRATLRINGRAVE